MNALHFSEMSVANRSAIQSYILEDISLNMVSLHSKQNCIVIAPLIFNLCTRWRCVLYFMPSSMPSSLFYGQRNNPQCALHRRVGKSQSLFRHFVAQKNLLTLLET